MASGWDVKLALHIIKEEFGQFVHDVADAMVALGASSLPEIITYLNYEPNFHPGKESVAVKVRAAIVVLMTHYCVTVGVTIKCTNFDKGISKIESSESRVRSITKNNNTIRSAIAQDGIDSSKMDADDDTITHGSLRYEFSPYGAIRRLRYGRYVHHTSRSVSELASVVMKNLLHNGPRSKKAVIDDILANSDHSLLFQEIKKYDSHLPEMEKATISQLPALLDSTFDKLVTKHYLVPYVNLHPPFPAKLSASSLLFDPIPEPVISPPVSAPAPVSLKRGLEPSTPLASEVPVELMQPLKKARVEEAGVPSAVPDSSTTSTKVKSVAVPAPRPARGKKALAKLVDSSDSDKEEEDFEQDSDASSSTEGDTGRSARAKRGSSSGASAVPRKPVAIIAPVSATPIYAPTSTELMLPRSRNSRPQSSNGKSVDTQGRLKSEMEAAARAYGEEQQLRGSNAICYRPCFEKLNRSILNVLLASSATSLVMENLELLREVQDLDFLDLTQYISSENSKALQHEQLTPVVRALCLHLLESADSVNAALAPPRRSDLIGALAGLLDNLKYRPRLFPTVFSSSKSVTREGLLTLQVALYLISRLPNEFFEDLTPDANSGRFWRTKDRLKDLDLAVERLEKRSFNVRFGNLLFMVQLDTVSHQLVSLVSPHAPTVLKLLLSTPGMEEKMLVDKCMLDSKVARTVVFKLVKLGFVTTIDVPRRPDRNPQHTVVAFTSSQERLFAMAGDRCLRALLNMRLRAVVALKSFNSSQSQSTRNSISNSSDIVNENNPDPVAEINRVLHMLKVSIVRMDHSMVLMEVP